MDSLKEMTIDQILFRIEQLAVEKKEDYRNDSFYEKKLEELREEVRRRIG